MKIAHISDLHGDFPTLPECDLVINSGDWMPNSKFRQFGNELEEQFQNQWLESKIEEIQAWLGARPMIFVQGNHDYTDPSQVLVKHKLNVVDITNKLIEYKGLTFYGFPYIPAEDDAKSWNHRRRYGMMELEFDEVFSKLKEKNIEQLDFFVCHCPPWDVFDTCPLQNRQFGNKVLTRRLEEKFKPKHLLCGHIHGAGGQTEYRGVKVSQAARIINIIDL